MDEDQPASDPLTPPDDSDPFDETSPADEPLQDLDDQDPLAPLKPTWPDDGE